MKDNNELFNKYTVHVTEISGNFVVGAESLKIKQGNYNFNLELRTSLFYNHT